MTKKQKMKKARGQLPPSPSNRRKCYNQARREQLRKQTIFDLIMASKSPLDALDQFMRTGEVL